MIKLRVQVNITGILEIELLIERGQAAELRRIRSAVAIHHDDRTVLVFQMPGLHLSDQIKNVVQRTAGLRPARTVHNPAAQLEVVLVRRKNKLSCRDHVAAFLHQAGLLDELHLEVTVLDLLSLVWPELAEVLFVDHAGEHHDGLRVVIVDHLPERVVGVEQRVLSDDELLLLTEAWQEGRVYVIAAWFWRGKREKIDFRIWLGLRTS